MVDLSQKLILISENPINIGRFLDKVTVETETYLIKAKRFIIATGSSPFAPPIKELGLAPYLTNETIFTRKRFLAHL